MRFRLNPAEAVPPLRVVLAAMLSERFVSVNLTRPELLPKSNPRAAPWRQCVTMTPL
jgi:hypothetical protein